MARAMDLFGRVVVLATFAFIAWHLWLHQVAHQTPDQWIAGVRAGLGL